MTMGHSPSTTCDNHAIKNPLVLGKSILCRLYRYAMCEIQMLFGIFELNCTSMNWPSQILGYGKRTHVDARVNWRNVHWP